MMGSVSPWSPRPQWPSRVFSAQVIYMGISLGLFFQKEASWGSPRPYLMFFFFPFPALGHPPPGDFIALGSKGQVGESKTAATLLKPTSSGLPSERKREAASSALSSSSGLAKRPKLSSTPPLSALGRLAEAAVAEKRAISPSIKEPSVIPIEGEVCGGAGRISLFPNCGNRDLSVQMYFTRQVFNAFLIFEMPLTKWSKKRAHCNSLKYPAVPG